MYLISFPSLYLSSPANVCCQLLPAFKVTESTSVSPAYRCTFAALPSLPTHFLVTGIDTLFNLSLTVIVPPTSSYTLTVYSLGSISYPLGATSSLTLYFPWTNCWETMVPSAPVVNSKLVPSTLVTLNLAPARPTFVSTSTLRIFSLFASTPIAPPPAVRYFHTPSLFWVGNVPEVIVAPFVWTISPFSTVDL